MISGGTIHQFILIFSALFSSLKSDMASIFDNRYNSTAGGWDLNVFLFRSHVIDSGVSKKIRHEITRVDTWLP